MYFETRDQHIRYVIHFHMNLHHKLSTEKRRKDAIAVNQEMCLDTFDSQWLFVKDICSDELQ